MPTSLRGPCLDLPRHDRTIVPAYLDAPLGILDVSSLRFLLSSSTSAAANNDESADGRQDERPASSELARAYGVPGSDAHTWSRRQTNEGKRRRRPSPAKLDPVVTPIAAGPPRHRRRLPAHATTQLCSSLPKKALQPHVLKHGATRLLQRSPLDAHVRNREIVYPCVHPHTVDKQHSPSPSFTLDRQLALASTYAVPSGCVQGNDELRQEIQWIRAHFPVRLLANTKCSLALRCDILADTLRANLIRLSLRDALARWQWVVAGQQQLEASRLAAFDCVVDMFERAAQYQIQHRFQLWVEWAETCREVELCAAAIAVEDWYIYHRQRRQGRKILMVMSMEQAMVQANSQASVIQRAYRLYDAQLKLRKALDAVKTIQKFARDAENRRAAAETQAQAIRLEQILAEVRREQQLQVLVGRTRDKRARKIAQQWRHYLAWREQLLVKCVSDLVDQVEFFAAVLSVQRHIRGYQCRLRLRRKVKSATRIQHAWLHHASQTRARQARVMLMMNRRIAASCLQRTFRRNKEQKIRRAVMTRSSQPMFVRALHESSSFRVKFFVPIVKSAVSVIQSTWRRHVKHKQWKTVRDVASRHLQRWLRRANRVTKWHVVVRLVRDLAIERRRVHAAVRIQRWFRNYQNVHAVAQANQLIEMFKSVATIQRYYRSKNDRWRRVVRDLVRLQLPRVRNAATKIQICWQRYAKSKRTLLAQFNGGGGSTALSRYVGLHELQLLLTQQHRELDRRLAAARTIQKAQKLHIARRDDRLFRMRYCLLFRKELRRKRQREIIHGYLTEKHDEQARHKQVGYGAAARVGLSTSSAATASLSAASAASPATNSTSSTAPSPQPIAPMEPLAADVEMETHFDDSDVVKCWSEEYQCFYLFNTHTGESTWC